MKFSIEIDIPEVTEEYLNEFRKYKSFIESKTVCRFNEVSHLVDNPYSIIIEITNQINELIRRPYDTGTD